MGNIDIRYQDIYDYGETILMSIMSGQIPKSIFRNYPELERHAFDEKLGYSLHFEW